MQKRIGLLETQLAQRKADVSALRQKLLAGALTIGPPPRAAAAPPVCMQVMSASVPAAADVVMQEASLPIWQCPDAHAVRRPWLHVVKPPLPCSCPQCVRALLTGSDAFLASSAPLPCS